jgi:hypothetical protein
MLRNIANRFDIWVALPSVGMSGGILVGCDSSQFLLEQAMISSFSVTLMLKNRVDNTQWTFTSVYGHVYSSLKAQFCDELRQIKNVSHDAWLIYGDFNVIHFSNEKSGPNFQARASSRFNAFLDDLNLIEYELPHGKFT